MVCRIYPTYTCAEYAATTSASVVDMEVSVNTAYFPIARLAGAAAAKNFQVEGKVNVYALAPPIILIVFVLPIP